MECKKEENKKNCACTYSSCPRQGMCCECIAYHRANGEIPGCLFSAKGEATYDRSLRNFIEDQS